MRSKSSILDQSNKVITGLPKTGQLMAEHDHLFLEIWIDMRDQLIIINRALQALNKHLSNLP